MEFDFIELLGSTLCGLRFDERCLSCSSSKRILGFR